MTSIIETFEPAALCLLASLVWAPIVLAGALRLDRGRSVAASETLWICALCIAVLPTLMAPALEAAGVSLRPERVVEFSAPSDAAPLIAAREAKTPSAASTHVVAPAAAPSLSADLVFGAAALIYTYGALLALGAYLVRGALFARQVRCARPVDHPELLRALGDFSRRLGVKRRFELRRSEAVSTVCVFGLFRPVILMPRDIDARLSLQDLALMGAHELAHVKRGDAALYTFCALLRVVFWFNPFVRQIAARAELAAEQGADALVLSLGADRRRYAACFIEGLKFAAERAQIARFATPSFTPFDRQSRRDRLNAILEGGQRRARPLRLVVAVALAVAGGGAFAQAGLAVAPQTRIVSAEPVRIDTREGKPMRAPFDG
ncbi:MAG: M56 family metallopeptidase, partial [Parvularculaceae bacterium]|nr:M56 family metallopeptidase [Parvularculaceae bacterium]